MELKKSDRLTAAGVIGLAAGIFLTSHYRKNASQFGAAGLALKALLVSTIISSSSATLFVGIFARTFGISSLKEARALFEQAFHRVLPLPQDPATITVNHSPQQHRNNPP